MLESSRTKILELLGEEDVVLDVGGWADPFERADWVIDLMPYESRGLYAREGWGPQRATPERFGPERWVQRDLCDRTPFPFADGELDYVVCSHTLEDLRDPVWVCDEIVRIGRAGYVEVPSRLEEQSFGVEGPWVGWRHHRWLIDVTPPDRIEFALKDHSIHSDRRSFFPSGFWERLSSEERVSCLWWDGGFESGERVFVEEAPGDGYMPDFVARESAKRPLAAAREAARRVSRRRRRPGS